MLSDFLLWLRLGMEHITDLKGYDHILFVSSVCAVYSRREWKSVLWLVTAFTLGHSITLALSTLRLVNINTALIELLIPLTIIVSCLFNIFFREAAWGKAKYALTAFFGLIHGLGFSNFLRNMLGNEDSLFVPLLAFNLGLEVGQLVIVALAMCVSLVVVEVFHAPRREWTLVFSGSILGMALTMAIERF
jgi:hypothetical protein